MVVGYFEDGGEWLTGSGKVFFDEAKAEEYGESLKTESIYDGYTVKRVVVE